MDRRDLLKGAAAGVLSMWASRRLTAQQAADSARRLPSLMALVDGGGSNVLALNTAAGMVVVDSGAPGSGDKVMAALRAATMVDNGFKLQTLFNTHYHSDQTGNNEVFAATGAKIIAHDRTRQWMSTDYWLPAEDRYEKARPKAAWPTQTFFNTESMKAGGLARDKVRNGAARKKCRFLSPSERRLGLFRM